MAGLCGVEWVDEGNVRHGCIRSSADHKRAHQCGCDATLDRTGSNHDAGRVTVVSDTTQEPTNDNQ